MNENKTISVLWLGTATVEIIWGDEHILIDPYFQYKNKSQNELVEEAVRRAKLILITHPHTDHFSNVKMITKITHCPIYVARRGIEIAKRVGADASRLREIRHGDVIEAGEAARICVWESRHIIFDRPLIRTTAGRVIIPQNILPAVRLGLQNRRYSLKGHDVFGFEIIIKGKKLFVLGTLNLCEDMAYPEDTDLLMLPYQGRSDLEEYVVPLLERLPAKRIMLTHFDDAFPPVSAAVNTEPIQKKFSNIFRPVLGKAYEI